jgi:glycosyltransferase involved in cell wall biosynthesis
MEISVIITNFNNEKFIARSIRSAINQSFSNKEYEIIVVDDCSSDNSKKIIGRFGDKIKYISNDINCGLSATANMAVKAACGKFCVFVDSDDFINKNLLMVEHDFLSHNKENMDACSCDYYEIDEKEVVIRRRDGMAYPIRCGTMYYTDHLIELGPYNESEPREDLDFRKRFLQSGKYIYNLPVPYYKYTQRKESLTKNPSLEKGKI